MPGKGKIFFFLDIKLALRMKTCKPVILHQLDGNTEEQEFPKWHIGDFYAQEDILIDSLLRLLTHSLLSAMYLLGII